MDVSSDAGARDELDKQATSQRIKDLERQLAAFDSIGLGKTVNVFRSYRNCKCSRTRNCHYFQGNWTVQSC